MKILELFKGSGSITKYYEGTDNEVISLDFEKKYEPDICCDIMDWNYKEYPVGYFDIIWASPECKVYSSMNIMNIGENQRYKTKEDLINKQKEDSKFINRTIEIIDYLNIAEFSVCVNNILLCFSPSLHLVKFCCFGKCLVRILFVISIVFN